ncbi:hypothetical protein MFLO_11380 [Listeria floridensis FSL S10-1187]|uniref:Shikimate kinase n=1 Tax=Listeria floridensis FSL S10-1187 TaxID=1265817 RepID=A0ABN0RDJ9_9LIST|nr:shikimate kinase [Listeria floridensis]EUJ29183.1 hypothetical protein MFLO_11380 [Listeria floridensis FSL S10-1187]
MASGKTTVGEMLAAKTELPFIDIDKTIEKEAGIPIRTIFERHGEAAFRKMEQEQLRALQDTRAIISTGGGIILASETRAHLSANPAAVVYLKTSPSTFLKRLEGDKTRPLVQKKKRPKRSKRSFARVNITMKKQRISPFQPIKKHLLKLPMTSCKNFKTVISR